jgi:predicted amidophosphoribosyltransferase
MICPICAFDNPEGVKFCGGCGKPQPPMCPACGFENPVGFKFCGNCGIQMISEPNQSASPIEQSPILKSTDAELRNIPVNSAFAF